ncbi:hypothetical protein C1646_758596 [Rhizophagus diaphanus]|nr:hypothetical protein C1646_758596 [Rhizophagus diaphanus] [Rhizophagus sp. MUCL 43196]
MFIGEVDHTNVDDTMVLLSPIKRATCLLSASSYSTHGDVRFVFLSIKEHLSRYINDESFSQCIVADAIYQKLSNYWLIMSESSQISSLLDPRVKFTAFEDEIEKANAKNLVLNLTEYSSTLSPLLTTIGEAGDDIVKTRNFFRNLRNNTVALENTNMLVSRTLDNEMERYLAIPLEDQAFSVAGLTISPLRNRLDAETARVTLCLKSWIHEAIC